MTQETDLIIAGLREQTEELRYMLFGAGGANAPPSPITVDGVLTSDFTADAFGSTQVIIYDVAGNPISYADVGTKLDNILSAIQGDREYETVAASQTAQVLGPTGAIGDYLAQLLVIPATTSPGNVLLLDNATSITVFAGGASSVASLVPFSIVIGAYSVSGAWKVTTGTNVSVIGIGNFT